VPKSESEVADAALESAVEVLPADAVLAEPDPQAASVETESITATETVISLRRDFTTFLSKHNGKARLASSICAGCIRLIIFLVKGAWCTFIPQIRRLGRHSEG
jgi:hypothetical protein